MLCLENEPSQSLLCALRTPQGFPLLWDVSPGWKKIKREFKPPQLDQAKILAVNFPFALRVGQGIGKRG